MMAYSEDHIALAAEYALGTLDADERAQVETMMSVDKDFTAMVAGVGAQARLAEPDGRTGRAAARGLGQNPGRGGTCRTAGADCAAAGRRRRSHPRRHGARRRAIVGVQRDRAVRPSGACATSRPLRPRSRRHWSPCSRSQAFQPDLLPEGLRPKPRTQVVEVKTPSAAAPSGPICRGAAEGRRFARLHSHGGRHNQEFHGSQGRRRAPSPARVSSCG